MNIEDIKVGMILIGTQGITICNEEKVRVIGFPEGKEPLIENITTKRTGLCIPRGYAKYYRPVSQTMKELLE